MPHLETLGYFSSFPRDSRGHVFLERNIIITAVAGTPPSPQLGPAEGHLVPLVLGSQGRGSLVICRDQSSIGVDHIACQKETISAGVESQNNPCRVIFRNDLIGAAGLVWDITPG